MEVRATSGQVNLYSQIFKPLTTALRQVMMREIACTIERVERKVTINSVYRAGAVNTYLFSRRPAFCVPTGSRKSGHCLQQPYERVGICLM